MGSHDNDVRYSDLSPFVELFRTEGRVKIIDVFIRKPTTELTATEIATLADVDPSTFSRNKDALLKLNLITEIDHGSGHPTYKINKDSKVVKSLVEFYLELNKQPYSDVSDLPKSLDPAGVAMASALSKSQKPAPQASDNTESKSMSHQLIQESGPQIHS